MSRTSGTYTAPANSWNPAVQGTTVDEADWNSTLGDIEAALTESVYTSGLGATDNRLLRTDGTDTKKVQGSAISVDDSGNVSGVVNQTMTGYLDVAEIATPSNPSANIARFYAYDDGGTTKLAFRDSAGTETVIGAATGAGLLGVSTRTALKALDTTSTTVAYLTESGREGVFRYRLGNYAALVTADTQEGIYLAADSIATTTGAWVRDRPARQMRVEWFGVTAGGAVNNSAAVTGAIAVAAAEAGGQILVGGYYRLVTGVVVAADDIEIVATDRASGFYSDTAGKQLIKFTGSRQALRGVILNMPVFTSTTTDYVVWLENVVQFRMEDCRIQGGYHCVAITGGACADNTYINNSYQYATGIAMVYLADSTAGVNGAHHFYRCLWNQPYATATPNGTSNFKGARANTTAYSLNDVVIVGNYYLQCSVAGTSGGSAPTVNVWYGVDISDGTVTWRLMANINYSGLLFDTNVYYSVVRESDFTGPFQYAIRTRNSLSGTPPQTIRIEQCTSHGPVSMGLYIEAGRQIHVQSFETWNATDNTATTYGVFAGAAADDVKMTGCEIFGMDVGVYIAADRTMVSGSTITGNTTGVSVAANTNNFRVIDNNLHETARWGANTTAVAVASGTSNNYSILGNLIGTATIADSGNGANKSVGVNGRTSAFLADKNGTDQTGIADVRFTQVTFGTEVYDRGGNFASSTWTPPAGIVTMTAAFLASGTWSAGALIAIQIRKNGSALKQGNWYAAAANIGAALITVDDVANGTDTYDVYAYIDVSSGTGTISGSASSTYFCGHSVV